MDQAQDQPQPTPEQPTQAPQTPQITQPPATVEPPAQSQTPQIELASEQTSEKTQAQSDPQPTKTPEAKPPQEDKSPVTQVVYVGASKRSLAAFIDGIVLISVILVINLAFGITQGVVAGLTQGSEEAAAAAASSLVGLSSIVNMIINLGYSIGFLVWRGATPGKMALGLVVINTEFGKISFVKAALRETIGRFLAVLVIGLGYLWIIWDEKKQGWHDKIAGTLVVEQKSLPQ
jgi:uncharacterized RDD family membrane protein YckC